MMDGYLGKLDALGCTIVLTADHGMNAKTRMDSAARRHLPAGRARRAGSAPARARVILPITDPYVVHHGALGSFATVYLPDGTSTRRGARSASRALRGIEVVLTRAEAARASSCRADRIGDLVVVSERSTVIGTARGAPRPVRRSTRRCARTAASPSSACR